MSDKKKNMLVSWFQRVITKRQVKKSEEVESLLEEKLYNSIKYTTALHTKLRGSEISHSILQERYDTLLARLETLSGIQSAPPPVSIPAKPFLEYDALLMRAVDRDHLTHLRSAKYFYNFLKQNLHPIRDRRSDSRKHVDTIGLAFVRVDCPTELVTSLGDEVQRKIIAASSGILEKYFRHEDIVARWTTNEFAIAAPTINDKIFAGKLYNSLQSLVKYIRPESLAAVLSPLKTVRVYAGASVVSYKSNVQFDHALDRTSDFLQQARDPQINKGKDQLVFDGINYSLNHSGNHRKT